MKDCRGSPDSGHHIDGTTTKRWPLEEDVVISGVAGRYPESDSINELRDHLFAGESMISEDERRWPVGLWGLPRGMAKIKDISKFDNKYFGIKDEEAELMDPQIRILLEVVHEAIADAGINPSDLKGTNTGFFLGHCMNEVDAALAENPYGSPVRQVFAGRVAYHFDLRGPHLGVDTACASSFSALVQAVHSLRNKECDAAIVAGVNISLRPMTALQFRYLNMLPMDSKCKVWDSRADGYVKSEGVIAIMLQRASQAKRHYATMAHIKTNCDGFTPLGITYPSWEAQRDLMTETYQECGIDPSQLYGGSCHDTRINE